MVASGQFHLHINPLRGESAQYELFGGAWFCSAVKHMTFHLPVAELGFIIKWQQHRVPRKCGYTTLQTICCSLLIPNRRPVPGRPVDDMQVGLQENSYQLVNRKAWIFFSVILGNGHCNSLSQVTTTSKKSSTTFQIRWTTSSMTGDLALRNTPTAVAMHLGDLMRARHDVAKEGESWLRHRSGQAAQSLLV